VRHAAAADHLLHRLLEDAAEDDSVGCVLLEVIRNGLVLAQVNSYWQQALVGVIIILAVLVDRIRSRML